MISEIVAWLFAFFVIDPLHAEVRERVDAANLPLQMLQQSQACIATQGPRLLEKAGENPGWATVTAIGITAGWTSPAQFFDGSDANCAALITLLRKSDRDNAQG